MLKVTVRYASVTVTSILSLSIDAVLGRDRNL